MEVGYSRYQDSKHGTTRNTAEAIASVLGGWVGGFGGAFAGAAIGALMPGISAPGGGMLVGFLGTFIVSIIAEAAVDWIGNGLNYDVIEKICENCARKFKSRLYQGEREEVYCDDC